MHVVGTKFPEGWDRMLLLYARDATAMLLVYGRERVASVSARISPCKPRGPLIGLCGKEYAPSGSGMPLSLSDASALRWRPGSLYDCDGNDVDRVVLDKLQRAIPVQQILEMLTHLH